MPLKYIQLFGYVLINKNKYKVMFNITLLYEKNIQFFKIRFKIISDFDISPDCKTIYPRFTLRKKKISSSNYLMFLN